MENQSMRHIEVPNHLILTKDLKPVDIVVYLALKSFDGKDCFPSLKTISEKSGASINVVRASIKRLNDSNWINATKDENGHFIHYTFTKDIYFEPFSYEFLNDKELTIMEKAYLICNQQDMFKNSENEGVMVKSALDISNDINMPLKTIYKCEDSLKEKGILQITKAKQALDLGGIKKDIRTYNFSKYYQAIAYAIRYLAEKQAQTEQQVIQLNEDQSKIKAIVKHNNEKMQTAMFKMSKKINDLEAELKRLKKNNP